MKAISLWQPHATAVARGAKLIETRSWSTNYRGLIAIHAAKRCLVYELLDTQCNSHWCAALGWDPYGKDKWLHNVLPFGAFIAVANLVDCRPTGTFTLSELDSRRYPVAKHQAFAYKSSYWWTEHQMGDFSLGRFGWVLADIRPLATPIPYPGRQGLFQVPPGIEYLMAIGPAIASFTTPEAA